MSTTDVGTSPKHRSEYVRTSRRRQPLSRWPIVAPRRQPAPVESAGGNRRRVSLSAARRSPVLARYIVRSAGAARCGRRCRGGPRGRAATTSSGRRTGRDGRTPRTTGCPALDLPQAGDSRTHLVAGVNSAGNSATSFRAAPDADRRGSSSPSSTLSSWGSSSRLVARRKRPMRVIRGSSIVHLEQRADCARCRRAAPPCVLGIDHHRAELEDLERPRRVRRAAGGTAPGRRPRA